MHLSTRYIVELKYFTLLLFLLMLAAFITVMHPPDIISPLLERAMVLVEDMGIAGIFVASCLGNLAIFIQIPYIMLLLSRAASGASLPSMIMMGVASGSGAGLGKILTYQVVYKLMPQNARFRDYQLCQRVNEMMRKNPQSSAWLIFLFMASPLPDEAVILPLTMLGMSLKKVWGLILLGKIVHNTVLAILFYFSVEILSGRLIPSIPPTIPISLVALVGIAVAYYTEKTRQASNLSYQQTPA